LFFNGNTFAEIGRAIVNALFYDLPLIRRKEVASAAAHYVTGVMRRGEMEAMFRSAVRLPSFIPGDRVRTLRGSASGEIIAILDDGRVKWRTESGSELIATAESLLPDE
jgi:hypothetical protein